MKFFNLIYSRIRSLLCGGRTDGASLPALSPKSSLSVSRVCMGAAVISALLVLPSCIDELNPPCNNISGEHETFLTIYLPNVESAARHGETRADGNQITNALADAEEAKINTLWFFAYPVTESGDKDNSREVIVVPLDKQTPVSTGTTVFNYSRYDVGGFEAGGYHIYVLANMEDYTDIDADDVTADFPEEDLRNLVLNFNTTKYLEYGNLPMACLNTEMQYGAQGAPTNKVGDNGIFNVSKNQNEVFADLTFLCAKVRYTILFNKEDSDNTFSNAPDFSETVTAKPVMSSTKLIGDKSTASANPLELSNLTLSKVLYPEDANSQYFKPNKTDSYEQDLTVIDGNTVRDWENPTTQRAWQGIVYLPENYNAGSNRTTLHFSPVGSTETVADGYDFVLFDDDATPANQTKLERGKFYDAIAHLKNSQKLDFSANLSVHPWTTQTLSYALHGPYELVVETTKIEVKSGEWTIIGYNSDTEVSFISPNFVEGIYDDPLFVIEKITPTTKDDNGGEYEFEDEWENHLRITVTNDIPYTVLKNNTSLLDQLKYFHIKAGNLYKKIETEPITISPVLVVNPKIITINVGEYKSSGKNSDNIEITYSTNVLDTSEGQIILTDDVAGLVKGISGAIQLTGTTIPPGGASPYTLSVNKGELSLDITGLTSGNGYWSDENTYTVHISLRMNNTTISSEKVTIKIVPQRTNYVIHFKDETTTWTAPHIYVYQSLEVPYDLGDEYSSIEGKTVGFKIWNKDDSKYDYFSALEYMFSNNISFKGWDNYGGPAINDPTYNFEKTKFEQGFVLLGGPENASYYQPKIKFNTYAENAEGPEASGYTQGRYNFGIDLNEEHFREYDKWKCPTCHPTSGTGGYANNKNLLYQNSDGGSRDWPGIAMVDEGNGWFKYTLSGVATPGKTMIMFADGHNGEYNRRYPIHAAVGVPLFDYPDHEGWFLYNGDNNDSSNNYFRDDKPDSNNVDVDQPFVIYFDITGSGWTTPYVHYWGGEEKSVWRGKAMTKVSGSDNYYQFTVPAGTTGLVFNNNSDSQKTDDLVAIPNHVYNYQSQDLGVYNPNGGSSTPDKPTTFQEGQKLVFQCGTNTKWENIYVYDTGYNNVWPGKDFFVGKGSGSDKTYIVQSTLNGKSSFNYILNTGDGALYKMTQTDDKSLKCDDVDWQYENNVWVGYVTVNNYLENKKPERFYEGQQIIFRTHQSQWNHIKVYKGNNGSEQNFEKWFYPSPYSGYNGNNQIWTIPSDFNDYYWLNLNLHVDKTNTYTGELYIHAQDNIIDWRFENNVLVGASDFSW